MLKSCEAFFIEALKKFIYNRGTELRIDNSGMELKNMKKNESLLIQRTSVFSFLLCMVVAVWADHVEVYDINDKQALQAASIFNRSGMLLGVTDEMGAYHQIHAEDYPLTVRYVGYHPATIEKPCEKIFLSPDTVNLPEVTVNNNTDGVWMLCYARGYMNAPTNDIRQVQIEEMQDYIIPLKKSKGFAKMSKTRELIKKQTYHAVTKDGRDSVYQHLSKKPAYDSQFGGIKEIEYEPEFLRKRSQGMYKKRDGKMEISYKKSNGILTITKDWLAYDKDHAANMPWIVKTLFGMNISIKEFVETYQYQVNEAGKYYPMDLTMMSFVSKVQMSGKKIRKATKSDKPVDIFLWLEIYPVDYRFITAKESVELKKNPPQVSFIKPEGLE